MLKGTSSGKIMTEVGQFPVALIYGINMQTQKQKWTRIRKNKDVNTSLIELG